MMGERALMRLLVAAAALAVANGQSPEQVDQLRAMLNDELDGAGGGEVEEGADDNAPLELAPTGTTGTASSSDESSCTRTLSAGGAGATGARAAGARPLGGREDPRWGGPLSS